MVWRVGFEVLWMISPPCAQGFERSCGFAFKVFLCFVITVLVVGSVFGRSYCSVARCRLVVGSGLLVVRAILLFGCSLAFLDSRLVMS